MLSGFSLRVLCRTWAAFQTNHVKVLLNLRTHWSIRLFWSVAAYEDFWSMRSLYGLLKRFNCTWDTHTKFYDRFLFLTLSRLVFQNMVCLCSPSYNVLQVMNWTLISLFLGILEKAQQLSGCLSFLWVLQLANGLKFILVWRRITYQWPQTAYS